MGWVVNATPWPLYPPEKTQNPLYRAGWAPGLVWKGAEHLASTRFDPWTIHHIASHYTNCAILAPKPIVQNRNKIEISGLCCDTVNIFTLLGFCVA